MMTDKAYAVRAVRCDNQATEDQIYEVLQDITAPLSRSWERLQRARRVVLKFNMMYPQERILYHAGRRQELVDDAVAAAVLRLLRERTSAELVTTDTFSNNRDQQTPERFNFRHILDRFDVGYDDSNMPPFATYQVPGGGCMFDQYVLSPVFQDADEVVSVAKMKNHLFMGVTLCTKNLFGLPPMRPPEGRTRSYFHHLIRLSYVLPDLALIARPCLNIIDALTAQRGREWRGEGRVCEALIAGDHPIATDACGAHLMGHDPQADWPTPPFRRDRNHLLVASERGFGTVDLNEIDFATEVDPPLAPDFDADEMDPPEMVRSWRLTACEQGLYYRDHRAELVDQYGGEFIYLQDGQVVWHGETPERLDSRRVLAGQKPDRALWLKLVDPEEAEGEHFEVYQDCLRRANQT